MHCFRFEVTSICRKADFVSGHLSIIWDNVPLTTAYILVICWFFSQIVPGMKTDFGTNLFLVKHEADRQHYIDKLRIKMHKRFKRVQGFVRFSYCCAIPINIHLYQMLNFRCFSATDMMRAERAMKLLNFLLIAYPWTQIQKRFFPVMKNSPYGIMPGQIVFPLHKRQFMFKRITNGRKTPRPFLIPFITLVGKKSAHFAVEQIKCKRCRKL